MSDQIVFDPNRAGNHESQTAALAGIDKESAELLTLYLEIVGWKCVVVQSASSSTINSSQLLIIDDEMFRRDVMPQIVKYRSDLPIILVGRLANTNSLESRFLYLTTPLNIKDIEKIVEKI